MIVATVAQALTNDRLTQPPFVSKPGAKETSPLLGFFGGFSCKFA
jgi:hypothetical protein